MDCFLHEDTSTHTYIFKQTHTSTYNLTEPCDKPATAQHPLCHHLSSHSPCTSFFHPVRTITVNYLQQSEEFPNKQFPLAVSNSRELWFNRPIDIAMWKYSKYFSATTWRIHNASWTQIPHSLHKLLLLLLFSSLSLSLSPSLLQVGIFNIPCMLKCWVV